MTAMILLPVWVWLARVAVHDARTSRIPNAYLWPAPIAVMVMVPTSLTLLAAVVTATMPYLVAFLLGRCGGGDVKFALVCGGLVADPLVAAIMVTGAALSSAVRTASRAPHGPALGAACGLALLL